VGPTFNTYGIDVRVDNVAYIFEQIDWCQTKPLEYAPGKWKFIRSFRRIFSRSCTGSKYFNTPSIRGRLMHTIGLAELILNRGVPVLQEYALALIRNSHSDELVEYTEADPMYYRLDAELHAQSLDSLADARSDPVQECARLSYARAYGVPPALQLAWEQRLREWTIDLDQTVSRPLCLNPVTWEAGMKYDASSFMLAPPVTVSP
jgi:hypothetical protein